MLQSYIVYFGTLIGAFGFAILADRYNKKEITWLITLLLTLIAGLRAPNVGLDTQSYYANFQFLSAGQFGQVYGMEESFKYIGYVLMKIWNNPNFVFGVLAFITHGLIIRRLWDFRGIASFACMVACYYMGFYHMSLNVTRQFVAIGIVFYATRYLIQSRYLVYIAYLLIASLFHQSALIGVMLFVCELFKWNTFSSVKRATFLTIIVAMPVAVYAILQSLLKYEKYLLEGASQMGIMVYIKALFLIVTVFLFFVVKVDGEELSRKIRRNKEVRDSVIFVVVSYMIGLGFLFSSYYYEILNRMGWYFTLFESVYMGILVKSKKDLKIIYVCYIITVIGWGFLVSMLENAQGSMPYLFIWQ